MRFTMNVFDYLKEHAFKEAGQINFTDPLSQLYRTAIDAFNRGDTSLCEVIFSQIEPAMTDFIDTFYPVKNKSFNANIVHYFSFDELSRKVHQSDVAGSENAPITEACFDLIRKHLPWFENYPLNYKQLCKKIGVDTNFSHVQPFYVSRQYATKEKVIAALMSGMPLSDDPRSMLHLDCISQHVDINPMITLIHSAKLESNGTLASLKPHHFLDRTQLPSFLKPLIADMKTQFSFVDSFVTVTPSSIHDYIVAAMKKVKVKSPLFPDKKHVSNYPVHLLDIDDFLLESTTELINDINAAKSFKQLLELDMNKLRAVAFGELDSDEYCENAVKLKIDNFFNKLVSHNHPIHKNEIALLVKLMAKISGQRLQEAYSLKVNQLLGPIEYTSILSVNAVSALNNMFFYMGKNKSLLSDQRIDNIAGAVFNLMENVRDQYSFNRLLELPVSAMRQHIIKHDYKDELLFKLFPRTTLRDLRALFIGNSKEINDGGFTIRPFFEFLDEFEKRSSRGLTVYCPIDGSIDLVKRTLTGNEIDQYNLYKAMQKIDIIDAAVQNVEHIAPADVSFMNTRAI